MKLIPLWQPSAWPFAKRCLARARLFSSHSTLGRPSPSPWTPGARKPWQPRRRPAHLPSGGMRSAGRSSWRGNTNLLNNRRRVRLSRRNPDREQLSSVTNVTIISNRSPGWKFTSENRTRLSKLRRSFVEILKKRLWTSHSKASQRRRANVQLWWVWGPVLHGRRYGHSHERNPQTFLHYQRDLLLFNTLSRLLGSLTAATCSPGISHWIVSYFVRCDYLKSLCWLENPKGLLWQINDWLIDWLRWVGQNSKSLFEILFVGIYSAHHHNHHDDLHNIHNDHHVGVTQTYIYCCLIAFY